jgi:hypothetical protein
MSPPQRSEYANVGDAVAKARMAPRQGHDPGLAAAGIFRVHRIIIFNAPNSAGGFVSPTTTEPPAPTAKYRHLARSCLAEKQVNVSAVGCGTVWMAWYRYAAVELCSRPVVLSSLYKHGI